MVHNLPAAEAVWEPVPCVPADLPPEALFDTARVADDFAAEALNWGVLRGGQNAMATLQRDTAEKRSGVASLRVDYEFVGKPDYEYIQTNTPLDLPEPGPGIGFWLKHDGTPFPVRLRVTDSSGETHQVDLLCSTEPGWQFVAGTLVGRTTAWGGDGNGRLDYPCKLNGLCVDRPKRGYVGKGSLWIDDLALVRPRTLSESLQVETQGKRFGNVYAPGETVALRVRGQGDSVRWTLLDFWGREVASGQGQAAGTEARFPLAKPGYYACKLELLVGERLAEAQEFRCAALANGDEAARSDFVGVNCHFGQRAYPLDCLDLMRRYGINQFRDEISWRSVETEKGKYALPNHAAEYTRKAAELGLRPLILFDYSNPHYDNDGFPNSPGALTGFAAYAVELARATRGTASNFEVWNEWIGGCGMSGRPGDHGPEAYGRLLKETYAAVKQAFPDVTIVGIGGEYGPHCAENVVRAIGTAGAKSMDAFSIHPYRYPRSPEESDLVGEVQTIADRAAETGAPKKLWITEIGYPTHRTAGGSEERAQARHCVRTLILLQATGVVEKVYWYDLKDDGPRREYNEHNFGLIRHQQYNCAPKPGVVAMSVYIRIAGGATFRELKQQGAAYAASYRRPDGNDVLVAWTTGAPGKCAVTGQVREAVDLVGAPVDVEAGVVLTNSPLYLVGTDLSLVPDTVAVRSQPATPK
jgi:hypothetical protein